MQVRKLEFSNDVTNVIRDMCKLIFNVQTNNEVVRIFGLTNEQMEEVIKRIVSALPDSIFEQQQAQFVEEIKNILAREFIFFQVQEKWDDPRYQEDLLKFIRIFGRDIQQRINAHKKYQSTMRED